MSRIDRNNRVVRVDVLADLRLRITDTLDILDYEAKTVAKFLADIQIPWGSAHDQYPAALLIKQDCLGQGENPAKSPNDPPPQIVRVFEVIDPTLETSVGNADVDVMLDGIKTVTQEFLQFSSGAITFQVIGTQAAPAPWGTAILISETRTDDGTLNRIKRVYLVPGQISRTTEYRLSPDQGTTGVTVTTIRYRTGSSSTTNPITPPGGTQLITQTYEDSPQGRVWTAIYAAGTGVISSDIETRENGKLKIYTKTAINAVPSTPAATIGGTVVLIKDEVRNGTRFEDGTILYDRVWCEGNGQVATHIVTRQDGLREVTFISLGTRVAPGGAIVRDDSQEESGYTLYTVSAMQKADGGTTIVGVGGVSLSFGAIEEFEYPGRLKPFVAITGVKKALDLYKSPPIRTKIGATVLITYQTSGTLTLANTLWAPTDAAAMYAQWVGTNGQQHNLVESYPGYRYVSGGTNTLTATNGIDFSIFNQPIITGNTAAISATGGPVSPDGNTYALPQSRLEPAFTDTSGVVYYRKTEIYATIPAQTALPV